MTLTDFLLARIAEDEKVARKFHPDESLNVHFSGDADATVLYTAARVLAECEARRRIVGEHVDLNADSRWEGEEDPLDAYCSTCHDRSRHDAAPWPCPTLRYLALPYADHPDYREEWKP